METKKRYVSNVPYSYLKNTGMDLYFLPEFGSDPYLGQALIWIHSVIVLTRNENSRFLIHKIEPYPGSN